MSPVSVSSHYDWDEVTRGYAWRTRISASKWCWRAFPVGFAAVLLGGALSALSPVLAWPLYALAIGAGVVALISFVVGLASTLGFAVWLLFFGGLRELEHGFAWHNNAQHYWALRYYWRRTPETGTGAADQ